MNPQPKPKTPTDKAYRKRVEQLPCCKCGEPWKDRAAHHEQEIGHGSMGRKCSDYRCIPLCDRCHKLRHNQGRYTFWGDKDPEKIIRETFERCR